ncbi:MAG: DUF2182 domain-containing protein [Bacteroidota bacterium]
MSVSAGLPAGRVRALAGGALFLAAAALTVRWCGPMTGGMPMPGGWTMSMAWMRMPGESPADAAVAFLAMWMVMMVAMMLPSLAASVARSRWSGRGAAWTLAGGYFAVWGALGVVAYPIGLALSSEEMRSPSLARIVPFAGGAGLILGGFVQLTSWKARALLGCREGAPCATDAEASPAGEAGFGAAWRSGIDLGVRCVRCCAGYTLALFAAGVMDLRVMAAIGAAITAERLAPRPVTWARAAGLVVAALGAVSLFRLLVSS